MFDTEVNNTIKNISSEQGIDNNKVYHYTSIEAFQGIIKSNNLWLSERNCMNDFFDEKYIKDIIKKILNPNNSSSFNGSLFDRIFITDKPQYVFSTSIEKDTAHQWLSYGRNNPICLEFDKNKLVNYFQEYSKQDYVNGIHHYKNYFFSDNVIYDIEEVIMKANIFTSLYKDEWNREIDNLTSARSAQFKKLL